MQIGPIAAPTGARRRDRRAGLAAERCSPPSASRTPARRRRRSRCAPIAPATGGVTIGTRTVYVNPYTGATSTAKARRSACARSSRMVSWHRYMAMTGDRATGKAITGAANLLFLFLVLSGMYLWWPRTGRGAVPERRVVPTRAPAEGARLQLAQRHRLLDGAAARDRRLSRRRDLVSVGDQPRLPGRG